MRATSVRATKAAPVTVPYGQLTSNYLNLPRLPIPALADTARRYEASIRAIKKKSTIDNHMAVFNKFLDTDGARVQKALVDADCSAAEAGTYPFSYIEKLWDDAYLNYRGASPVNIAPAITFKALGDRIRELVDPADIAKGPTDTLPDVQSYLAAYTVHGLLRFAQKIQTDGVDIPADPAYDVSQMAKQFGFTRQVLDGRDSVKFTPVQDAMGHIVVMHRGHVFKVDTRNAKGEFYSPKQLATAMREIVLGTRKQPAYCLGAVTGSARDDWAVVRKKLEESPANAAMLESIDRAFTVVCLDTEAWGDDKSKLLPGMLTGVVRGTSTSSSGVCDDIVNRWYDKHQLIVDSSDVGRIAANFEHAFSDGMCWGRYFNEVIRDLRGKPSGHLPLGSLQATPKASEAPKPARLDLDFGDATGQVAVTTKNSVEVLNRLADGVRHAIAEIPYGKNDVKKFGLSPDAFCQAAFHLSYFRIHGRLAPTYESCSTRSFFHGRTETIRTASNPMYDFCSRDDMASGSPVTNFGTEKREEISAVLKAVSKTHVTLAREAAAGQGVDRHLLALREKCRELGSETGVAFFNEHVYEFSGTWLMSTSNVSVEDFDWFNFGPVCGEGYGIGYNIMPNVTHATVSAFEMLDSKAPTMAQGIVSAAHDLATILGGAPKV